VSTADLDQAKVKPKRLRRWLGLVGVPTLIVAALFVSGVHVGARHPDMWLSRLMSWLFS